MFIKVVGEKAMLWEGIKVFKTKNLRQGVRFRFLNGTQGGKLCQFKGCFGRSRDEVKCL